MADQGSRSRRLLAHALSGLLLVGLAANIVAPGVQAVVTRRYPGLLAPDSVPEGAALLWALVLFLVAVGQLGIRLLTIVVFCFWLYRRVADAEALSPRPFSTTPGWAVGWYFVPIMNLFKPYQAMREVYDATGPVVGGEDGEEADPDAPQLLLSTASPPSAPWQMKLWWAAWIAMNLLENAQLRFEGTAVPPAYLVASTLVTLPATLALLWVVHSFEDRLAALRTSREASVRC